MAQKLDNIYTYLIILVFFAIVVTGILYMGNETINNQNARLDNNSIEYIANLQGINITEYQKNKAMQEKSILITENGSQGNPKDESLDYLFAKEKGFDIELTIKRIFGIPHFILIDFLRFPLNNWSWFIDIMGWFLTLAVIISLVFYARGIK